MLNAVVLLKFYKGEISLFDQSAIECALSIPDAKVTLLAMAPQSVKEKLAALTRLGDIRGILISDEKYKGSDTLATSKVLSAAVKKIKPDIVLCGRQSMDGDTAQVPPQVATFLGYDFIPYAMDFNLTKIRTRLGDRVVNLPTVISVERIKTLRFPSLRSEAKYVEIWDNSLLCLNESEAGISGSKTEVLKVFDKKKSERKCKFISPEKIADVINECKGQTSVREFDVRADIKLDKVFVIGDAVIEIAKCLAEEVVVIESDDAEIIADTLEKAKAKHVLFEASLINRTVAPKVAARLNCGLAADCVGLETDGKKLFCLRPANADNVLALIGFKSQTEMATVRCSQPSGDVVFSVGYGAKDYVEKIKGFALKFGGEVAASRKVVDSGILEYERQVGLTGKVISPKVYVAIGISGEVQHLVGIENAKTVIAINRDKNAKIFEYADYGVVEDIKNVEL